MNTPYSYHTFYFPFIWNTSGDTSMYEYINGINLLDWKSIDLDDSSFISCDNEPYLTPQFKYQQVQYFTPAAQRALFSLGTDFIKSYVLNKKNASYYIEKNGEVFSLPLISIKLKVYNTGIAILMFEAENRTYRNTDSVKKINEYGRRTFPPYLLDSSVPNADVLGIDYADKSDRTDFRKEFLSEKGSSARYPRFFIPQFITNLLPTHEIIPALDDRMYVSCAIIDAEYFHHVARYKEAMTSSDETDIQLMRGFYELIDINLPGKCLCPTADVLSERLEQGIYRRWIDQGTLYAVSNHAFICLLARGADYVAANFLNIYSYIVAHVISQRAAIIAFDNTSSRLSQAFGKHLSVNRRIKLRKLLNLQEEYIAFLNQHMNIELTCQEQGIDLYAMLREHMQVDENNEKLNNELERLYEAANVTQDYSFNKWAFIFAAAAILLQLYEIFFRA